MADLCIVTDSTSDLPVEVRRELGIEVVPLNVHFGDELFKDGVDMDVDGFWQHLTRSPHHPKTSQPSPGDFAAVYKPLVEAGKEIVSIHISADLSGTLASAKIAADMFPDARIHLVDTRSVSMGLGMVVAAAARMARAGASAEEVAAFARTTGPKVRILFGIDTLEFLARNGRIGRASALLGGLLSVKPILTIQDGVVAPADKVRGKAKVLPRALELMAERIPAGSRVYAAALHANVPDEARVWLNAFSEHYKVVGDWIAPIGPVVAVHGGPGTVGIAMYPAE